MLFKSMTAFDIEMPTNSAGTSVAVVPPMWFDQVTELAMQARFRPLTEHQQSGSGWEPPKHDINEEYVLRAPGTSDTLLLSYRTDERKVSAAAVKEEVSKRIKHIETTEGRKVRRLEKDQIKDAIIQKAMPHTPPTPQRTMVLIDLKHMRVIVGTKSESLAGAIRNSLETLVLPKFIIEEDKSEAPRLLVPVYCRGDALEFYLAWMQDDEECPARLMLEDNAYLSKEGHKDWIMTGVPVDASPIVAALADGYCPYLLNVSVMSGDSVMAHTTIDRFGAFDTLIVPGEIRSAKETDDKDEQFTALYSEMVSTTLTYDYVAQVMLESFGTDRPVASLVQAASDFHAAIEDAGLTITAPEPENHDDDLYQYAVDWVVEAGKCSISSIQRKLRIGYNRAARLVELMESAGVVSLPQSNGTREILKTAKA